MQFRIFYLVGNDKLKAFKSVRAADVQSVGIDTLVPRSPIVRGSAGPKRHIWRRKNKTMKNMKQTSKLLSLILRHDPAKAGLSLGPGGWVSIAELLTGLNRLNRPISRQELETLAAENDKKRFSISRDGQRIRAAQGHSADVDLDLEPMTPPKTLFHGTTAKVLGAIMAEGLKPMSRQHVHLSLDIATAKTVGSRRGKPVILRVNSGSMHENGLAFYRADNGVWLTHSVAPEWIEKDDENGT